MKILRLPFIAMLFACGDITPTEGEWEAKNFDLSNDDCTAAQLGGIESESTVLIFSYSTTEDGFSLTSDEEGAEPFDCSLDAGEFDCSLDPVIFDFTDGLGDFPAFDAVITFTPKLSGTFSDANTATATSVVDGACEGEACDGVVSAINGENGTDAQMPCTTSIPFDMIAVSE